VTDLCSISGLLQIFLPHDPHQRQAVLHLGVAVRQEGLLLLTVVTGRNVCDF